jgi:glycosyltransferase involved in cell wall biosynthesis
VKIVFLCFAGTREWSDLDLEAGLGGSETMIVFFSRQLGKMGHDVTVCADVPVPAQGERDGVKWTRFASFGADVTIALRDPRQLSLATRSRIRAFLANDQSCCYLPEEVAKGNCNLVITISQFQTDNYQRMYPTIPKEMFLTSNAGVEWEAYQALEEKERGLCWYGSTPERGLVHLLHLWPRIYEQAPFAQLAVSSGFELYNFPPEHCGRRPGELYDQLSKLPGVTVTGAIPRSKLQDLQKRAEILVYPSSYIEQSCITAMEAAAAGCAIVTSRLGALQERVIQNETGYLIHGMPGEPDYDDWFVARAVEILTDQALVVRMGNKARDSVRQYSYDRLCEQWMQRFLQFQGT